jgi:hypothetical protein
MPNVRCSVSNCTYWAQGGQCTADAILVEIDAHANREFQHEFAGDLGENVHKDIAANRRATMCHTFQAKK